MVHRNTSFVRKHQGNIYIYMYIDGSPDLIHQTGIHSVQYNLYIPNLASTLFPLIPAGERLNRYEKMMLIHLRDFYRSSSSSKNLHEHHWDTEWHVSPGGQPGGSPNVRRIITIDHRSKMWAWNNKPPCYPMHMCTWWITRRPWDISVSHSTVISSIWHFLAHAQLPKVNCQQ